MLKIVRKKEPTQLNNDASARHKELQKVRKRVIMQAALAVMTVLLTVVIVFGMTAAWYTNVVQTGGLIFQVEELGVNVNAIINSSAFTAKPGDSGVISLTANNAGSNTVSITVSASKAALDEEMQKRLYFYVESQQTVNSETSQRTYLTSGGSYTYTVFSQNSLTLTEDYHNDAQLKWCWVYDVLGYYVLGTETNGTIQVQEYLRPIEYDYDYATFDSDGKLLTVDGTTTVTEFLAQLSATDGFAKDIDVNAAVGNYYPVGEGVYVYLCPRAEVEDNTDYDTMLGLAAMEGNAASYTIQLTVNAQSVETETLAIANSTTLAEQLQQGADVKLSNDITLSSALTIPAGEDVLLDLNGKTLATTAETAFKVEPGSTLTVINGTLAGAEDTNAFALSGAEVNLYNVNLADYYRAIWITDNQADGMDSTVRLTGCTFTTEECAVLVYGNGSDSEQTTKVIIEDCTLISEDIVICGNGTSTGTAPKWGTDIQIINSTIMQQDAVENPLHAPAIYHPQMEGTLNIYNSQITGYSGIAIKGGTVTVTDSTVVATATADFEEPKSNNSGASNTGDGIYVETGYGYDISLTITDSSVESYYRAAVRIYESDSPYVTYSVSDSCTLNSYSQGKLEETETTEATEATEAAT